ncbi:NADH dehydrogenase subunit 4 (mitochondrion) [Chlamydomonas eustigma]|uniref:NADH-ubiquinone oxidoreductase chain 4 n=1 Tax=Chlamydomonas eustigma TaxID=1157962 RepID=A0A250XUI7_9CHLO|nr:NADH dehydrogenase subunit 4 [Chlamydomonas eustigma]|eukprot:GAX86703.1 NADH dehydrogenase subunit 4 (mitochondrion) [Chlamydomonas eustigma]
MIMSALNPNNTIVCLLLTLIVLTLIVFVIPNGRFNSQVSNSNSNNIFLTKSYCLVVSFVPLIWSIYLWSVFDASGHVLQMVVILERLHISFGMDYVSLSLTLLTTGLFPICIMLMRTVKGLVTFLLLEIVIYGALNVLDLLGFYILFESSLILLFLLIGRSKYGSIEAAYKIVLYTMFGSLILLPIIFVVYALGGSTSLIYLICTFSNEQTHYVEPVSSLVSIDSIDSINLRSRQMILGWGLFLVFAVKIPLMPVHLWLPEAHVAAPTAGSILLAGILLKLGGIGFIRFLIPIVPNFTVSIFPIVCCLCLSSFLFSTLSTLRQIDLKKIIAYSSIGHMSMITLTIFSMSELSASNATFMMLAHGLVSPCLFLLVGLLYDRYHTKFVLYFSGLGSLMPIFSIMFFLCTLANLSFPLFPNFIAEFLCLTSIFSIHSLYAYIFCISQVLATVSSFWAFNRIIMGVPFQYMSISLEQNDHSGPNKWSVSHSAISRLEFNMLLPLMISILWLGVKPTT